MFLETVESITLIGINDQQHIKLMLLQLRHHVQEEFVVITTI